MQSILLFLLKTITDLEISIPFCLILCFSYYVILIQKTNINKLVKSAACNVKRRGIFISWCTYISIFNAFLLALLLIISLAEYARDLDEFKSLLNSNMSLLLETTKKLLWGILSSYLPLAIAAILVVSAIINNEDGLESKQ